MSGFISGFKMSEYKKFLNWEKPGTICAWFNIVVFIIFLFPLGLYAYWKRSKQDMTMSLDSWKLFLGFGIAITITGFSMMAVVNILIGLGLLFVGLYKRKIAFTRMDIIGALLVKREFNVRNISMLINKSEKVVHNEIDNMIKNGMLPGVRVNYGTNEVYVPGYTGDTMDEYAERVFAEEKVENGEAVETEAVKEETKPMTREEEEAYSDLKRKNNIKNHPLYTGICAACGEKMTKEAVKARKCQICGREYELPEDDVNYF